MALSSAICRSDGLRLLRWLTPRHVKCLNPSQPAGGSDCESCWGDRFPTSKHENPTTAASVQQTSMSIR